MRIARTNQTEASRSAAREWAAGRLRSVTLKVVAALLLMATVSFGGGFYAVTRLVETDALYSALVHREARAMRLVARAGIQIIDDSRFLLRLLVDPDASARERLLGERDRNQGRVFRTLDEAAALVPRMADTIASFGVQFRVLVEHSQHVEGLIAAGPREAALRAVQTEHDPMFAALRHQMRALVQQLEDEMQAASAAATRQSRATYARTLGVVGLGTALSLLLAAVLVRRMVTGPLRALEGRMRALEQGEVAPAVPFMGRRDEIGRMAGALESFRLAAIRQSILDAEANTDPLTGVLNRRGVAAAAERLAARPVAAIAIDLDHFKSTNDAHGHAAGDALLVTVGDRLREAVRSADLVGRLGGDEFVVILSEASTHDEVELVARRISRALHEPVVYGNHVLRLGATLGLSRPTGAGASAPELLRQADEALVRAKRARRGSIGLAET